MTIILGRPYVFFSRLDGPLTRILAVGDTRKIFNLTNMLSNKLVRQPAKNLTSDS